MQRIEEQLQVCQPPGSETKADVTILMGDLNYRVNCTKVVMKSLFAQDLYEVMLAKDQLNVERKAGHLLVGMEEGKVEFAPTYRFHPGTDAYAMGKDRIPSYTDRVLFSAKDRQSLLLVNYDSNNLVKFSDHRPVFAQFLCQFTATLKPVVEHGITVTAIAKQEPAFGQARSAACHIF